MRNTYMLTESANSIPDLCFFACSMMQLYCSLFSVSQIVKHDVASLCVFFFNLSLQIFSYSVLARGGSMHPGREENRKRILIVSISFTKETLRIRR